MMILTSHRQIHQNIDWSSFGRNKRVSELPIPTDAAEALAVLGDQYNRSWPIFHDEVTLHTDLSSMLFHFFAFFLFVLIVLMNTFSILSC